MAAVKRSKKPATKAASRATRPVKANSAKAVKKTVTRTTTKPRASKSNGKVVRVAENYLQHGQLPTLLTYAFSLLALLFMCMAYYAYA